MNGFGVGVGVGDGIGVGVGVGVAVGVGVGVPAGVAVGVGVPDGGVYVIASAGGFWPLSLELNRLDVSFASSFPLMIQPKLVDGLSSHACTSATIWDVEPHVYMPVESTARLALNVPEKSPPALVHEVA